MSITYETIIKVLCEKNIIFSNNINIMKYADEFEIFNNIFDNTFYKYGVYKYDNNNIDISLWTSILFLIHDNYYLLTKEDVINNSLVLKDSNKNINDLVKNININIIIFDFLNNKIIPYYNEYFNPYKSTLFIAKYNEEYEPIACNDTKYFGYNFPKISIFKKIIFEEIDNIIINDSLNDIVKEFNKEDDLFISQSNIQQNLTRSKINKMKKDELISLLNDLNIEITINKPTKKDLIGLLKI